MLVSRSIQLPLIGEAITEDKDVAEIRRHGVAKTVRLRASRGQRTEARGRGSIVSEGTRCGDRQRRTGRKGERAARGEILAIDLNDLKGQSGTGGNICTARRGPGDDIARQDLILVGVVRVVRRLGN